MKRIAKFRRNILNGKYTSCEYIKKVQSSYEV